MLTDPAVVPVTVKFATPAAALTEVSPETLPVPALFEKVMFNVLSAPLVMVFPAAS